PSRGPQQVLDQDQGKAREEDDRQPAAVDRQRGKGQDRDRDPGEHGDGEAAVVDEQCDQLARPIEDPGHVERSTPRPRVRQRATMERAKARKAAMRPRTDQSSPGQARPAPSPTQKAPKAESRTPTRNFSVFSGMRANGRCRTIPSAITTSSAAPAPRPAG